MKDKLGFIYKHIFPMAIRKKLWPFKELLFNKQYRVKREKRKSFGSLHKESTYYVIRMEDEPCGLFSIYFTFMEHVSYAVSRSYIPVIDLKNYYMRMIQDNDRKYKENAWDYYFKQPTEGTSLEEVYKSRNVVLSYMGESPYKQGSVFEELHSYIVIEGKRLENIPYNTEEYKILRERYEKWGQIARQYFKLSDTMKNYIDAIREELIPKKKRILGVALRRGFARGSMLGLDLFNRHPRQAEFEEYFMDIEECMKKWNCELLFLSVEDREACEVFSERYGDKCIIMERPRSQLFKDGAPVQNESEIRREFNRDKNIYLCVKEYMAEMVLLSECHCLLGSNASGVQAAYLMNRSCYEHIKIYDKGLIRTTG